MKTGVSAELETYIKSAWDHGKASSGQYHAARFIKSCLNFEEMCNMREVVYYANNGIIQQICKMSADKLYSVVELLNPQLLKRD